MPDVRDGRNGWGAQYVQLLVDAGATTKTNYVLEFRGFNKIIVSCANKLIAD